MMLPLSKQHVYFIPCHILDILFYCYYYYFISVFHYLSARLLLFS